LTPLCNLLQATQEIRQFDWPHAPVHRLDSRGVYMITAATLHKQHFFSSSRKLDLWQGTLIALAKRYDWHLHAWAVFPNHYHFIARSEDETPRLTEFLSHLPTSTASQLNQLDREGTRKVWYNFWDSKLTYERSYLARLNYVHQNPVKHGLVAVANKYRWCSAAWFERTSPPSMIRTIYGFKTDKLKMADDY
jgi:REP-associated tyrosine transposase